MPKMVRQGGGSGYLEGMRIYVWFPFAIVCLTILKILQHCPL